MLVLPAAANAASPVRVTFDAKFGLMLVTKGLNAIPIAPAKQDSLDFRLPVRRVSTDRKNVRTVFTKGGFLLDDPEDNVSIGLRNLAFEVRGRRLKMTGLAAIDGITYDRFAFADARVSKNGRKAVLKLNGTAVAALNSQLQTTEFKAGQRIGVATLPSTAKTASLAVKASNGRSRPSKLPRPR